MSQMDSPPDNNSRLRQSPSVLKAHPHAHDAVLPVYRRSDIVMVRGEGMYLYSEDQKRYLDFASGIAVNALGHCHPHLVAALKAQADKLWHCSNMYRMPGLERMAERLCDA